ncbi:Hypothetical protein NTJ_08981 [Nesidiocoris tenuis]|uniref:ALMS motif domain-containing protein n=1 Tax=Nesidiocoris tenuis TaxID=355587 RepID=A0ABN7B0B8_9HEMI|nr:Hypothetical protein NTJ_08981 [Nesidiocoris tenuis]
MSEDGNELDPNRIARSSYFQTEFTVSVKKGRDVEGISDGAPKDGRKVSISIQTSNRSNVGDESCTKERKRWVRPPLVGQASGSDLQQSARRDDSDDDVVESSLEPHLTPTDLPSRTDYISGKPPEGSSAVAADNRAPSPASASSLTSGQRDEFVWDSGADVGYFQPFAGGNADKLSSIERMALGGSASFLTRSDPEGTVSNSTQPPPPAPVVPEPSTKATASNSNQVLSQSASVIGSPNAESTPNITSPKASKSDAQRKSVAAHLFPKVIVQSRGDFGESDQDSVRLKSSAKLDEVPKRSSSLEDIGAVNQQIAPFVRSQSQNNLNFDMNAHLQRMVQPQSNSSSSVATVVKGKIPNADSSEKKDSDSGSAAEGRANSFEYLPGAAFQPPDGKGEQSGDSLRSDIKRGVRLLSDFMKGTNANNTLLKKKLLKSVVDEILTAKYPGDESSLNTSPEIVSVNWSESNRAGQHSSTWQGNPSLDKDAGKTEKSQPVGSWPLEYVNERCVTRRGHNGAVREISGESGSQASLLARMKTTGKSAGTSGSTLSSSSVSESIIKQHPQPVPCLKKRTMGAKPSSAEKYDPSSSSTHSDWKVPVTKSEKIYEQLKRKGKTGVPDSGMMRYLNCERENQLDWIKKEIDHLSNLKRLLEMHENLRRNFDDLKLSKSRKVKPSSADPKNSRVKRKSAAAAKSEPTARGKPDSPTDNSWDSHDYGLSTAGGVLKKNASTNTFQPSTEENRKAPLPRKPVSYTIIFDSKGKENAPGPLNELQLNSDSDPSTKTSRITIANRDVLVKESRERVKSQFNINLQEELLAKKPEYVLRAEMRRQAVAEIAAVREIREKNRNKILSAAINGEPPPPVPNPLAFRRVVSQKSMRALTEKNYKKSALVKQRQRERKREEERVTNRLMAEMYNRNLQKRILRGETYLSNSVNVL